MLVRNVCYSILLSSSCLVVVLLRADPLIKEGAGILTLYEDNTTTFTGDTFINGGTLALSGLGTLSTAGLVTIASGATFNISASTVSQIIGSLTGDGSVSLGSVNLTLGGSNASNAFSGSFSGTGTITKTGTGIFTLSGDNSGASFPLIIQSGTVSISANNNFSTGTWTIQAATLQTTGTTINTSHPLTLSGGGTIQVPTAASAKFSGIIGGTGTLNKTGAGILRISGSNSYSGATVVSAGTLSLEATSTLPANSDLTVSGSASVLLNDYNQTINALIGTDSSASINLGTLSTTSLSIGSGGTSASFSGSLTGSGSLIKTGSGTQTLLGSNSYTGGTQISSPGGISGNTASLQGNFENAGTLTFNQTSDGIFTGSIGPLSSALGHLIKEGSGLLHIEGGSITQTDFAINAGTVQIDTNINAPITISSGGTLTGIGTVLGALTNAGTVAPGEPTGQITVTGSYTQSSGSVFNASFNPTGDTSSLIANSTIAIGSNTTLNINPEFATYPPNSKYTLLSASSGLTGQFTYVNNTYPTLDLTLKYTNTALLIQINLIAFSDIVTKGNAGAIARCFDSMTTNPSSDLTNIINILRFSNEEQLYQNFTEMQPSMLTALDLAKEENVIDVNSSIANRLNTLHFCPCADQGKLHVWEIGGWTKDSQSAEKGEVGFKTKTRSFITGIDSTIWDHGYLGGVIGYALDTIEWDKHRGDGSINEFYGGIYGGFRSCHFYIQGASLGSFDHYKATRKITLIGEQNLLLERSASHYSPGWSASSYLETGFSIGKKILFEPFARADYVFVQQKAFTESGADSLNLHVQKHNSNLLRAEAGAKMSFCWNFEKITWIPYAHISWVLERRYQGSSLQANLMDSSCIFTVHGLNPNRHLFAPSGGILMKTFYDHLLISCDYSSEWGSKYHQYTWSGKIQLNF